MTDTNKIKVIKRLLDATRAGRIAWVREDQYQKWFSTELGDREICFRFLYLEACNQDGADRYAIELFMPGISGFFACGTEGYCLMRELYQVAFEDGQMPDRDEATEFLDEFLPEQPSD